MSIDDINGAGLNPWDVPEVAIIGLPSPSELKILAKRLHAESKCGIARAHNLVSKSYGFKSHVSYLAFWREYGL